MPNYKEIWHAYSPDERRNMAIYIGGIMAYKLGLEFFNGSIITLATDRFNSAHTYSKLGAASGLNQAAQCVGAILIAPLVKRWPTRTILGISILLFGIMTLLLLIVDAATGGKMKPSPSAKPIYGDWNPNLIFVVWTLAGISYGMVELIRRVIPADIVGGNVGKLRRMDALVHVLYEVSGTIAAFGSSSAISRWGNNYSFFLSPIFFALAAAIWFCVSTLDHPSTRPGQPQEGSYIRQTGQAALGFAQSIWVGSKLVLLNRCFIWLLPSYTLAFFLHRFLESNLAPAFAKGVLGNSAWAQNIVGGSNFGELLGALSVFLFSDLVATPLPWLRLDAFALNLVWLLPYFSTRAHQSVDWSWKLAACFIPISFGWAAGDVSLAAYIQSVLSDGQYAHHNVSALGAVMAFLYSAYIVIYAVLGFLLGRILDSEIDNHHDIKEGLIRVGGIHYSVCCAIILISTFIPYGAFSLNPRIIGSVKPVGTTNSSDVESDDISVLGYQNKEFKKEFEVRFQSR